MWNKTVINVHKITKNATKPNPFKIVLLQTTKKGKNWKTEEMLERAVVTLETGRIKGSNPWCLCWKLQTKLVVLTRPGPRITLNKDTAMLGSLSVGQTGGTKARSVFCSSKHVRILPGARMYGYVSCICIRLRTYSSRSGPIPVQGFLRNVYKQDNGTSKHWDASACAN